MGAVAAGVMGGVVVIGAGGHAKVCIESLTLSGIPVRACVGLRGDPVLCRDVPVRYGDERLGDLWAEGHRDAFVALGPNALRVKLADYAQSLGFELVNAIHPSAVISPSARLGRGVAVMAGAVVNAEAQLEDLVIVNTGATVDHDCRIGRAVHVAPQCAVAGNVTVGERSFLGIGSRVVPDLTIANDVVIGGGAVVVRDVDEPGTLVGVPARRR